MALTTNKLIKVDGAAGGGQQAMKDAVSDLGYTSVLSVAGGTVRDFDADNSSDADLYDVLATLIIDLKAKGVL